MGSTARLLCNSLNTEYGKSEAVPASEPELSERNSSHSRFLETLALAPTCHVVREPKQPQGGEPARQPCPPAASFSSRHLHAHLRGLPLGAASPAPGDCCSHCRVTEMSCPQAILTNLHIHEQREWSSFPYTKCWDGVYTAVNNQTFSLPLPPNLTTVSAQSIIWAPAPLPLHIVSQLWVVWTLERLSSVPFPFSPAFSLPHLGYTSISPFSVL